MANEFSQLISEIRYRLRAKGAENEGGIMSDKEYIKMDWETIENELRKFKHNINIGIRTHLSYNPKTGCLSLTTRGNRFSEGLTGKGVVGHPIEGEA